MTEMSQQKKETQT